MILPSQPISSRLRQARLTLPIAQRALLQSWPRVFQEVASLRQLVIDQAWQDLSERGSDCHGLGYSAFRRLQGGAITANSLDALDSQLFTTFAKLFQIAAKGKHSAAFVESLRNKLENSDPQQRFDQLLIARQQAGRPPLSPQVIEKARAAVTTKASQRIDIEDSIDLLSKGKTKGVSLLDVVTPRIASTIATEIDRSSSFALMALCRGRLANVHAQFNLALASVSPAITGASSDHLHDMLRVVVEDYDNSLRLAQQRLYAALVEEKPAADAADVAVSLAGQIEQTLPQFVGTQAALRLAMLQLKAEGKGTAAERMGRLALTAGALTREAIASHCASYRLALALANPHVDDDVTALLKRIKTLPFTAELPNGKNKTLKQLDADLDGQFVEIEGFVTAVSAKRGSDGKLISHIALLDPSSGATADAVVVFAHLPHAGVTTDSFCRINGTFKKRSTLFNREPAVEVDILALAKLSKASWQIAFLRLANRWFEPWRNGANLYWSLGPHKIDDDTGLLGAGELLYSPLVRK